MSVSGNFATARRATVDSYSLKMAGEMLDRSPGAYQSTSMATGISIDKLKDLFPNRRRGISVRAIARVIPTATQQSVKAISEGGERTTVGLVVQAVCAHYGVSMNDMISGRRDRKTTRPRQVAMWLACTLTKASTPEIGRRLGGRDHTTVLHGRDKVEMLRHEDDQLQSDLDLLTARLLLDTEAIDLAIANHLAAIEELTTLKLARVESSNLMAA